MTILLRRVNGIDSHCSVEEVADEEEQIFDYLSLKETWELEVAVVWYFQRAIDGIAIGPASPGRHYSALLAHPLR